MEKNWIDQYLKKKNIFLALLFVLFVFFRTSIWKFYNQNFVDKVLISIDSHWLVDVVIIVLAIATFIIVLFGILSNKRISNTLFIFLFFLFTLFVYCRLFTNVYTYTPFYWFPTVKYIDYLFLLFGSITTLKIYNWLNQFQKPQYFNSPFLIDFPINDSSEDIYKRSEFAELLAEKIQSELKNKNAGAIAIGINGPWGSGKTSFSNLINEKLNSENRIIIHFNPWRSASPAKIIEDYFELLISELEQWDSKLSKDVSSYATTLTKIDENLITKSVEAITDYIFSSPNKNESYDKINNAIARLKKQIIIFIDDLDRLDMNETIEVLRLIRNTANFNSVVYIVSYDKGYVLEAVKKFNPYNYRSFLEKIFQFEFLLPGFDNAITRNRLKGLLTDSLNSQYHPFINSAVDFAGLSGKNITSKVLRNNRDVLRFSNSLLFEIKNVISEVNFIDFYLIQLLKLKFTSIYNLLADHFEIYFIQENGLFRLRTLSEKDVSEQVLSTIRLLKSQNQNNESQEKTTLFELYIKSNISENYTELEKDTILEIVDLLLKEKDLRVDSASKDYKSFVFSKNFNIYFNIKVLESNFTAKEFEEFRYSNFEKYKAIIFKWIKMGRLSDVQEKLEKILDFSNKQEWENHWKLLVEIAKHQYKESGVYGINYREIIDVLNYPNKPKGIGHVFFANRDEYLDYVWDIFRKAPEPYVIESSILTSALTPYASLPFSNEQIENQLLNYFKKYCKDHAEITTVFRDLHKNAVKKSDTYGRDFEIQKEAQQLFVDHFLNHLTGSQLSGFIKHTEPEQELYEINYEWVRTFFNEPDFYDKLEHYLENSDGIKKEIDHYEEFMNFYELFRHNNYQPVEFQFVHLKPSRWNVGLG